MRSAMHGVGDVVVIGAGVGGLSAAIDLAVRGYEVLVIEAAPEAGGKLGRAVVDGVEFDTGPSVLTMTEVVTDLFECAGSTLSDELALVVPDVAVEYRWPDGARLAVHHDTEATLASISDVLGVDAAEEFADFLTYAEKIWEAAGPAFVYGDAPGLRTVVGFGFGALGKLRDIDFARSMNGAIEDLVREPHLRDLLRRYATYNGSDPYRAPATLNCICHVELSLGCYGISGGMYELARALERVARRVGVRFEFERPVRRITVRDGRVVGIEDDGRRVAARAVVANADVRHVFDELLESPAGWLDRGEPSMSAWTGIVRAERQKGRPPHAVSFPQDYAAEFRDIFELGRAPRDPTVYVSAQGPAHLRAGWRDHEPLFLMANAPATHRGACDVAALRREVLEKARREEWIREDDELVWERTPHHLADRFQGSQGAIYGGSSNSRLAAFRRPANRVESVRGLYLASGSAHPGGGLPLAILSGRAAARALAGDFDPSSR